MRKSIRIGGEELQFSLKPHKEGEQVLEAWWPETMCSPLPCQRLVERWSDGDWRVAGQNRPGHSTAEDAARDYLRERVS